MQVLSLKVTEFNEENNVLRDEFTRCNQSNLALNKKIIYYQEKIKLYQESQGSLQSPDTSRIS
jgi:FtsZ-binding cell division protein ZapB